MKLNHLTLLSRPLRRRTTQVLLVGGLAAAIQVACSDTPQNGVPTLPASGGTTTTTGGSTATTAGTTAAAGTFATAAGTFGTAGTDAGGTFAAAGTGGTAGAATGGTGGAAAGTAIGGTGGTTAPPVAYCMGKTVQTLPYKLNTNYYPSGWSEGNGQISTPADLLFDACTARVTGAVGACTKWRYTPAATPTPVWVIWQVPPGTVSNVCMPDGVNSIAFCARGEKGGETMMTGGAEVTEAEITLTNEWKLFTVPLTGVSYNTFADGVDRGFVWKIVPPAAGAAITEFFIDNIQYVNDAPTADYCAGGDVGAGGAGGAGP